MHLHAVLVVGVVGVAFGLKEVAAHPTGHLPGVSGIGVGGGVALVLVALVVIVARSTGRVPLLLALPAVVLAACAPLLLPADGVLATAVVAAGLLGVCGVGARVPHRSGRVTGSGGKDLPGALD